MLKNVYFYSFYYFLYTSFIRVKFFDYYEVVQKTLNLKLEYENELSTLEGSFFQ